MVALGAIVVEVLETVATGPTSKSNLDAWINTYKLPITSMMDADPASLGTYTALQRREQGWIVDLSTMKIVKKYTGTTDGSPDGLVSSAKTDLAALLK